MTTEDYSPGSFGCHEALDRCELLTKLVGDLGEHPAIKRNPAWEEQVVQAASILADLYQAIAREHLGTDPDDPPDLSTEKWAAIIDATPVRKGRPK